MILRIIPLLALLLLGGCGAPDQVAITQTGNPSQITLAFAVGTDSSATRAGRVFSDPVSNVTITSAQLAVHTVTLFGKTGSLVFHRETPYVVNLALDSSSVILDSLPATPGFTADSVILELAPATALSGNSIVVKGFVNGDSKKSFEFKTVQTLSERIALAKPLVTGDSSSHAVQMKLDISQWFKTATGELKDPTDEEALEEIEESIIESISGEAKERKEIEHESEGSNPEDTIEVDTTEIDTSSDSTESVNPEDTIEVDTTEQVSDTVETKPSSENSQISARLFTRQWN